MSRIPGADLETLEPNIRAVIEGQRKQWGEPLGPHLIYARRPTIYRAARMMWSGLDASGLIDPKLVVTLNRRVASLVGCEF